MALPSFIETGRGVGLRNPAMGGRPGVPVSSVCAVVMCRESPSGRHLPPMGPLHLAGQSQPVSYALAGELTPASPIVIAAAATTIAALRRKVIRVSLVRCVVQSHPPIVQSVERGLPRQPAEWLI